MPGAIAWADITSRFSNCSNCKRRVLAELRRFVDMVFYKREAKPSWLLSNVESVGRGEGRGDTASAKVTQKRHRFASQAIPCDLLTTIGFVWTMVHPTKQKAVFSIVLVNLAGYVGKLVRRSNADCKACELPN